MTQSLNKRLRNRRLLSWNSMQRPAEWGYRTVDRGICAGCIEQYSPGMLPGHRDLVIMRRLQLALLMVLMGSTLSRGATPGSVSGFVCDSAGVPQIGAVVELLRPDMSVVSTAYTSGKG